MKNFWCVKYYKAQPYNMEHTLCVCGWASGVDDLARILLDNKSDIKFNKRLMTRDCAVYWVNSRNARFPDAKPWKVKVHTHTVCVPYYKAAPYNISHT